MTLETYNLIRDTFELALKKMWQSDDDLSTTEIPHEVTGMPKIVVVIAVEPAAFDIAKLVNGWIEEQDRNRAANAGAVVVQAQPVTGTEWEKR